MVYSKTFILVKEEIKEALKNEIAQNQNGELNLDIECMTDIEELAAKLDKNKEANVILFESQLLNRLFEDEIIEFVDIIKKIGLPRIIYFYTNQASKIVSYLIYSGIYDLYPEQTDDTEYTIKFFQQVISKRKTYIQVRGLLNKEIDFSSKEHSELVALLELVTSYIRENKNEELLNLLYSNVEMLDKVSYVITNLRDLNMELEKESYMLKLKSKNLESSLEEAKNLISNLEERVKNLETELENKEKKITEFFEYNNQLRATNEELVDKMAKLSGYYERYSTFNFNRYDTSLKLVIYFKEYSYPRYFNTFLDMLLDTLRNKMGKKTRLMVYEQQLGGVHIAPYQGFTFITENKVLFDQIKDKDNLLIMCYSTQLLELIAENKDNYEILIIYDRTRKESIDLVVGSMVYKFALAKNMSDIKLYKLQNQPTFSTDEPEATFNLTTIDKFGIVTTDRIKKGLYRPIIDKFLQVVYTLK